MPREAVIIFNPPVGRRSGMSLVQMNLSSEEVRGFKQFSVVGLPPKRRERKPKRRKRHNNQRPNRRRKAQKLRAAKNRPTWHDHVMYDEDAHHVERRSEAPGGQAR